MQPLPHIYNVAARGKATDTVGLTANGLPDLSAVAPPEFGGPGDQWSPETLLCAAVASCFILTFRAVARASKLEWQELECKVAGKLERIDNATQFTRFVTHATLRVGADASTELCRRLLEKAEQGCLITNSLRAARELETVVLRDGAQGGM